MPHGASVSFSAVEVKGMWPEAMNFSEGAASIYAFVLRKERCVGHNAPGMRSAEKVNGNFFDFFGSI